MNAGNTLFLPILRVTSEGDPLRHEAVPCQIHKQDEDGTWTRVPLYTGTEKQNRKQFKVDSNRSWFQYILVHQVNWRTSTRSLTYRNLAEVVRLQHPGESLSAQQIRSRIFGDCTTLQK